MLKRSILFRRTTCASKHLLFAGTISQAHTPHSANPRNAMKRSRPVSGRPVSPPPTRKKIESSTTGKVVANFFKKASEKEPDKLRWRILHETLLVGKYEAPDGDSKAENGQGDVRAVKRRKIAAFDFDSTLIKTSSGTVFGKSAEDWQWWDSCVPKKLRELHQNGYQVIVISNQAGINIKSDPVKSKSKPIGESKRLADFKAKVAYVFAQLDLPISIYAATEKDGFRKPRTGMWTQLIGDYGLHGDCEVDIQESFFIGDAGGRSAGPGSQKADHSCSDRDFAANTGITFHTPEEYFLEEEPRPFLRTIDPVVLAQFEPTTPSKEDATHLSFSKKHEIEVILLCGSPGAGKSTFYDKTLKPLGYERVNQDILKSRDKCLKVAAEFLAANQSVAVDNTNADVDTRKHWINLAKKNSVPIRAIHLITPPALCRHNDTVRAAYESKAMSLQQQTFAVSSNGYAKDLAEDLSAAFNPEHRTLLPSMAFTGFQARFTEPSTDEGFDEVIKMPFVFRGSEAAKTVWGRYWI